MAYVLQCSHIGSSGWRDPRGWLLCHLEKWWFITQEGDGEGLCLGN